MKKIKPAGDRRCHTDDWLLGCAAISLLLFLLCELLHHTSENPHHLSAFVRVFATLLIVALVYLWGILRQKRLPQSQALFVATFVSFALYLYLLINFTLLDAALGRWNGSVYAGEGDRRRYYMEHFVNFRPFYSVWNVYIRGFVNGYVHAYYVALNLLGNLCAFMPLAIFLPFFFKAQRKWYVFLGTMLLTVIAVESAQCLFMLGSCDIDDLILNAGGAVLAFLALRLPPIKRLADRFYHAAMR